MTRYLVDEQSTTLLRTWSTGCGDWAALVAPLPPAAGTARHQCLAAELTSLSNELWRCYTHPPQDPDAEVNTDDWRRQQTRHTFSTVIASVMNPELPDGNGSLLVSGDPVGEAAHRVGRALLEIGDESIRAAVRADVEAELQAVENAERGQLTGRAGQAAVLSRSDPVAAHIVAADTVLRQNLLDAWAGLRELEPTAAAVAAAHWLKAAVHAVARFTRMPARRVLSTADDEIGTDHRAAAEILALLDHAGTYDVVTYEVDRALQVAEGYVDGIDQDAGEEEIIELTLLNPQRPAPDLLDELLDSIHSCRHLYARYVEKKAADTADPLDDAAVDAAFCDAVRAQAGRAKPDLAPSSSSAR